MQRLHCTHFLRHQYPSTPHPLFPTYHRTVRGPRASAVLVFHTDQMDRVHSSEEAPHSFIMAPCVVLERLEGKQRFSRAPVVEHAELQAREWPKWLFTEKRKINEDQPNSATAHHLSSWPAQAASHESMLRNRIHIFAIFPPWTANSFGKTKCLTQGFVHVGC